MSSSLVIEDHCPLCGANPLTVLDHKFKNRSFLLCNVCYLISAKKDTLLTPDQEKLRYQSHINTLDDAGYVHFLGKLAEPIISLLSNDMIGLDYGCGPTKVLAEIISKSGYICEVYDPYFYPELPSGMYDFITSTECFEHFNHPDKTLSHICSLLKPNGWLGLMTETWNDLVSFSEWSYVRDLTHVSFYHQDTLTWIGTNYGLKLFYTDRKRVFVFKKI